MFTKGLPIFTMIIFKIFIQNLMKHIVNLDAYWYNECIMVYSNKAHQDHMQQCVMVP